jgi:hypothetical protein
MTSTGTTLAARREAPSALALAAAVAVPAVWLLAHPYVGVARDAVLYIGRAVADLDPAGVGRQLDFAHDGQSGFTAFRPLARLAVAALGPGAAALALTAAGLAAWIAAAAFLMSRFAKGPLLWAALVAIAVMPADYGDLGVYRYAEALATPRLLAEALGLAALGWLVRGRRVPAFALLLAAAALHPLIALPAWAVALVLLGLEDKRWLLAGAAAAAVAVAAAAMGAPLADRLFQTFDPAWRAVVTLRTPPVFVVLWAPDSWALVACQLATVLLAAVGAERGLRVLLLAAAGVAAGAIAASFLPSLLIVQAQPWRAGWLLAVLAAGALPLAAAALWRPRAPGDGSPGRAALALLAIAWLGRGSLALAGPAAAAALALGLWPARRYFPRLAVIGLWAAVVGLALGTEGVRLAAAATAYAADPRFSLTPLLLSGLPASVLVAVTAFVAVRPPGPAARRFGGLALAGALAALAAGLWAWDDRPPFTRWAESVARNPPLRPPLRSGTVYWVGFYAESWLVTGLPEWWSRYQGGGVVFDRGQAMEWSRLGTIAHAARLVFAHDRLGNVSGGALTSLCRAPDGPDWVIAAVAALERPALAERAWPWRAGAAQRLIAADGKTAVMVRDYAIFACADVRRHGLITSQPDAPSVTAQEKAPRRHPRVAWQE